MEPQQLKQKLLESAKNISFTFTFGKHKGKPFTQVLDEAPTYLNWLYENIKQSDKEKNKFQTEFVNHYQRITKGSTLVPFGKYKSLPLSWVKDWDYLNWVYENIDASRESAFYKAVEERLSNKPTVNRGFVAGQRSD